MVKVVLKEMTLGLSCVGPFRVIMGPLSHSSYTGVAKVLRIKYYLHGESELAKLLNELRQAVPGYPS